VIKIRRIPDPSARLESVLARVKLMELTVLCMNQMHQYLGRADKEILDVLILEGELQVAKIKRRVVNWRARNERAMQSETKAPDDLRLFTH
jgi:hypothetical protein